MAFPTIPLNKLSDAINDRTATSNVRTVLEGILNDFMDLTYAKTTPYTTGQQVLPSGTTEEVLEEAIKDNYSEVVNAVLKYTKGKYDSGDRTPQVNDGSWETKFTPVLQLVTKSK